MASLSNTLLMIPRELPSYLKVAYSLRYANEPNPGNCVTRIFHIAQRVFSLVKELNYYRPSRADFQRNREILEQDFTTINHAIAENQKPICVYFVSTHDHNGAILGNQLYYYHHYKIQNLQKHFAVAPKLVSSQDEMKTFMQSIKQQCPTREIKFIDIVSHGGKSSLSIHFPEEPEMQAEDIHEDLFSDCAPDATILLDACITGLGDRNIADEIARKTPGRTVLAPGPSLYFSKPIIHTKNNSPRVVSAVHGFAIFNAYVCKSFSYSERQPSQYPYVKDESLAKDILSIARFSILQNSQLDQYLRDDHEASLFCREDFIEDFYEEKEYLEKQVVRIFDQLSEETQVLITKQIAKNNGVHENYAKIFLGMNPLHASVRSAFRSVLKELMHEVREYPLVKKLKILLWIKNISDNTRAFFRDLVGKPAIAPLHLRRA